MNFEEELKELCEGSSSIDEGIDPSTIAPASAPPLVGGGKSTISGQRRGSEKPTGGHPPGVLKSVASEITQIIPSAPMDNPRHERFCRLVVKGGFADWECYQIAYEASGETARTNAWRLRDDEGVRNRIAWLQSQSAQQSTLSATERRAYLARIVRADLRKLGEADGDLIQEITRDAETGAVVKVKLPGKRECIETDAKLAGEWDGPQEQQSSSVVIEQAVMLIFGDRARDWSEEPAKAAVVEHEALTEENVASTAAMKESGDGSATEIDT